MTSFCKTYVPTDMTRALEGIQGDEAKVKAYGHTLGVEMCRKLLRGGVPGLHFYTLNLEVSAPAILHTLGLVKDAQVVPHRELPWNKDSSRKGEGIRPIFWANRYVGGPVVAGGGRRSDLPAAPSRTRRARARGTTTPTGAGATRARPPLAAPRTLAATRATRR